MIHAHSKKPNPRSIPFKVYLNADELATLESHCAVIGADVSPFLRQSGLREVTAHQNRIRTPSRKEGPDQGLRRPFSFPGQGARRVSRGALRPMRS